MKSIQIAIMAALIFGIAMSPALSSGVAFATDGEKHKGESQEGESFDRETREVSEEQTEYDREQQGTTSNGPEREKGVSLEGENYERVKQACNVEQEPTNGCPIR